LSAEEITLGGKEFGRAFDPAALGGDDGGALKLELRFSDTISLNYSRKTLFESAGFCPDYV